MAETGRNDLKNEALDRGSPRAGMEVAIDESVSALKAWGYPAFNG